MNTLIINTIGVFMIIGLFLMPFISLSSYKISLPLLKNDVFTDINGYIDNFTNVLLSLIKLTFIVLIVYLSFLVIARFIQES